MSLKTSIILELIQLSLQILQAQVNNPSISVEDDSYLLLSKICQNDNYSETPAEIDKMIGLIQLACDEIERDPRFHALRSELALDPRLRRLTMPDGTSIPGTDICLAGEVMRSILWRYLNLTKRLSWNQSLLEKILAESDQTLERGYLRVDLVLPLIGLSGAFNIPRIDLDQGWFLREMTSEEYEIFNKHIQPSLKLPCTMIYPGDEPPPFLRYALVREALPVPFSALVPPGNVIDPQVLPFDEIDFYLSMLQVSTAQAEPGPNFSISSPVIMYRSKDWAINTFGNPFNINFSWPLHMDIRSFGYYRIWFAAPGNWNEWVIRCISFIKDKRDDERRRIRLALRWYAESVRSHSLEDRLIKLMIAGDALFVPGKVNHGRGILMGQNMAKWYHNLPEQRKYRKFIQKVYKNLRHDLIHDGATVEILNRKIQSDKCLADLQNVLYCADMFETCFLCAWNGMVVKGPNDTAN